MKVIHGSITDTAEEVQEALVALDKVMARHNLRVIVVVSESTIDGCFTTHTPATEIADLRFVHALVESLARAGLVEILEAPKKQ